MKKIIAILTVLVLPLLASAKDVVSVLYFDNTTQNADFDWLSKGIADMLITDLSGSQQIDVVDRQNMQQIMQEHSLVLAGMVSDSQAVRLGEMLNANKIIHGSFIIQGSTIRIDAKVTDTETGRIVGTLKLNGAISDVLKLETDLVKKVFETMGLTAPVGVELPETTSYTAAMNYYRGMIQFDSGNYEQAATLYREATDQDPFYDKPQLGLQEAYSFLNRFREQRYQREINELIYKAKEIRERLAAADWVTYGDLITGSGMTAAQRDAYLAAHPSYFICDTPALCTWNLQMTLMEIGDKYEEYFEDEDMMKAYYAEAARIAGPARTAFASDPNLAEILYAELLATRHGSGDWAKVKELSEYLMRKYPTYRMMWAVENFYESALEALSEQ